MDEPSSPCRFCGCDDCVCPSYQDSMFITGQRWMILPSETDDPPPDPPANCPICGTDDCVCPDTEDSAMDAAHETDHCRAFDLWTSKWV